MQNTNNDYVNQPKPASNLNDDDYNDFSYLAQKPIQPRTPFLRGKIISRTRCMSQNIQRSYGPMPITHSYMLHKITSLWTHSHSVRKENLK